MAYCSSTFSYVYKIHIVNDFFNLEDVEFLLLTQIKKGQKLIMTHISFY